MKQVVQSFRTGELTVADVPTPVLRSSGILVRTGASLVSAGTERTAVAFAHKNLLQKAQARPDLVRQVVTKAQREGVLSTFDGVRNRLDQPLALGYSSAGTVLEVGAEAGAFQVGDRVACAGGGYASHAEAVYIPRTLAVRLPDAVTLQAAAFTTLGAIAMQGIRQAGVVLGQNVAVIGLGLVGQLTVQMLKAAGCRVLGVDLNAARVALALEHGADAGATNDTAIAAGNTFSGGHGFDAVLITADTGSDEPVTLAGELARDRAVVVAVGAVGMNVPRKLYYEKELELRLSRSYGPGRYDPGYEEHGQDYPYAYVRWTEGRNMEAFVHLLATRAVQVEPLISHRFPIDDAAQAYDIIAGKSGEPFLGVLLTYAADRALPDRIELPRPNTATPLNVPPQPAIRLGMVGAGNFSNGTLLPALRNLPGLCLRGIISGSGMTARISADRFGFSYCASKITALLEDDQVNWLAIATRHHQHAEQAIAGLLAGKDVFVEKPLALRREDLLAVLRVQRQTGRRLMVGFNRRFAPLVQEMQRFLAGHRRPLIATYRVNAGAIPRNHWTQDPAVGGGRIIGEAIHFLDLLQCVVGALPVDVFARTLQAPQETFADEMVLTVTFADGSVGSVIYASGGDKAFGKERVEVLGDGKVAVLDDFRSLELVQNGRRRVQRAYLRGDKGHRGEWEALVAATQTGGTLPISIDEIAAAHLAVYAAVESARRREAVAVDLAAFQRDLETEEQQTPLPLPSGSAT